MNGRCPRVTVGVPVFNGESFIAEALDSLLSQTFSDFEIVISDNASTDRTEEICRAYAAATRAFGITEVTPIAALPGTIIGSSS